MPPDDDLRRMVRYAVTWADRLERSRPGVDWWAVAAGALDRAVERYDPARSGRRGIPAWMRRNLRHAAADAAKAAGRAKRRPGSPLRPASLGFSAIDPRPGPVESAIRREEAARVAPYLARLESLPPPQAAAVRAVVMGGQSTREHAPAAGCSQRYVCTLVRLGLAALRGDR